MIKALMIAVPVAAAVLAGCSTGMSGADYDKLTAEVVKASFQDKNLVKVDRLVQDETMAACSAAEVAGKPLDEKAAKAIEAAAMKTIKWPSDGKFLGDWKQGEKEAQSGRGATWSDAANVVNGGNCYNCHQIDKKEISYGTIGPSLWNYGKLRGVTDPNAEASKAIVEYTWGKMWNTHAYNACSHMPRFGHKGVLSEKQLKDIMALLLDPRSAVNQ
jgi:L-cysteine S-thiosulfotransferase